MWVEILQPILTGLGIKSIILILIRSEPDRTLCLFEVYMYIIDSTLLQYLVKTFTLIYTFVPAHVHFLVFYFPINSQPVKKCVKTFTTKYESIVHVCTSCIWTHVSYMYVSTCIYMYNIHVHVMPVQLCTCST